MTIERAQLEAAARATLDRLLIAQENAAESSRLWGEAQQANTAARDNANRDRVQVTNWPPRGEPNATPNP